MLRGAGAIVLRKEVCPSVRLSGRPGPKWGRKRGSARVKIPACSGWEYVQGGGAQAGWRRGRPAAAAPTRGPPHLRPYSLTQYKIGLPKRSFYLNSLSRLLCCLVMGAGGGPWLSTAVGCGEKWEALAGPLPSGLLLR